jgi:hypothetical protein
MTKKLSITRAATLLFISFMIASCTKSGSPETVINPPSDPANLMPDTSAVLLFRGVFQPTSGITISGTAKVYRKNNAYQLSLDSFRVSNGPDLKVYLSKEYPPANFINLGPLQATTGMQLYNIPGMPNFSEYKYALIHCQQYNHLFGIAALTP